RNYLFRTINGEKDFLKNALGVRDRERLGQILDGNARSRDEQLKPLRLPTESTSFRRYTGAVACREAELLTEAAARTNSFESRARDIQDQQVFPDIVSERSLETVVTVLRDFKSDHATYAAEHLRASGDLERLRAGEILTTFKDMKRTTNERGQPQYQITIPEDSTIPREDWRRMFDRVQPQLTEQRAALHDEIPKPLAHEIRRTAIADGWKAFDLVEASESQALVNAPALGKAIINVRQQVDAAATLQRRLAVAHAAQTDAQGSSAHDKSPNKLAELRAYNHQIKENFLSSFALIDEAQRDFIHTRAAIVKDREEKLSQERVKLFTAARPELQERVSEYLKTVLRDHGETAFESGRGGAHHALMVGAIIKDGLKERGFGLSAVNLDDERVDRVAQEIVGNLPRDLRTARERNAAFDRERMIERNGFDRADEREHQTILSSPHSFREHDLQESRATREPHQSKRSLQAEEIAQSFDDEFVEQKVASHLGRTHPVQPRYFNRPIHDHSNQQAQTHETTQQKERVIQLTLSR
ncbi:MAG: hypothetical protein M3430_05145, partial [Acidobacteriota bacterium]|nr:hypothetical protein [Acidobacteriota bacterium]